MKNLDFLSKRIVHLKASEIREILKVTEQPDVISFAGGLPDPALFPVQELRGVALELFDRYGNQALQYGTTEGLLSLRKKIAHYMNQNMKTSMTAENIIITSGSQQGLDLTGKLLLDEGDVVLCEKPTYLGAIQAYRSYLPQFVELPSDDEGILPDALEKALKENNKCKLLYTIPDFQNPTGQSWSMRRREQIVQLLQSYPVWLAEDSPYSQIRFSGVVHPALSTWDMQGRTLFYGSFSKVLSPGLRVGWIAADPEIIQKYVLIKQAADLHTSTFCQLQVDLFLEKYDLDTHVQLLRREYKQRRDKMVEALQAMMPKQVKFRIPEGGMFIWLELPENQNAGELLKASLKNKVAFVPGSAFYPNGGHENKIRLNYSNTSIERITEGIRRLAETLTEE